MRTTTLLSGATSPFTVDSAASVGRRPREDVASEPKEEPKVDEPELQRAMESDIDPGAKPKIEPLVLPSLEHRMLESSLLPPRSPPGRRDLHQPLKLRDRWDRPKAKRQASYPFFWHSVEWAASESRGGGEAYSAEVVTMARAEFPRPLSFLLSLTGNPSYKWR
ncbi:uncharacterized protein LOC142559939 [Dermacentor variabilis]|uniref:uncharacterized protein LOC142559939 n=1 Tax=Dermacentor variabilis TaxID=34621 RepID=UPI003F5C5407